MKFPVSLVTIAISTVALAYCVPPSPPPSIVEGQKFFSKNLKLPGANELLYCSSQFKRGPITFSNVTTNPSVAVANKLFEVDMKGSLSIPLSDGIKIRVYDLTTDQDLSEPIDFFSFMKRNGAEVPTSVGDFHVSFAFTPQFVFAPKIGINLYTPEGYLLLCLRSLLFY
ncbi:CSEP0160 putative effector protein [Blumeria hordei DH14]|uniref:CSEP0160 putative effector protein n=1 Tax=Blumeria graminis f. sp. hordei (strain DH14) TaxID=546991 RepID=N1JI73_BLUG1|nr:CSEP0160 putative effector protein [Blumeria hordei DH14]